MKSLLFILLIISNIAFSQVQTELGLFIGLAEDYSQTRIRMDHEFSEKFSMNAEVFRSKTTGGTTAIDQSSSQLDIGGRYFLTDAWDINASFGFARESENLSSHFFDMGTGVQVFSWLNFFVNAGRKNYNFDGQIQGPNRTFNFSIDAHRTNILTGLLFDVSRYFSFLIEHTSYDYNRDDVYRDLSNARFRPSGSIAAGYAEDESRIILFFQLESWGIELGYASANMVGSDEKRKSYELAINYDVSLRFNAQLRGLRVDFLDEEDTLVEFGGSYSF